MFRTLLSLALVAAGLAATPGAAQGVFIDPPPGIGVPRAMTGKRAHVARELRHFGFGTVDLSRMSNTRIALLDNTIHSNRSDGDKKSRLASLLRGGGLLQGIIDNLGGRRN